MSNPIHHQTVDAPVANGIGGSNHGIPRAEWVRRFTADLIAKAGLDDAPAKDELVAAELESWPEQEDGATAGVAPQWVTELPESAVDECLGSWVD